MNTDSINIKNRPTKTNGWRLGIQILFFGIIASVALGQWLEGQGMAVSWLSTACFHAICPFGGVVSIYQLATSGGFVQKVDQSAFILMYIAFALAVIIGPAFCWAGNYSAEGLIILPRHALIITLDSSAMLC
jgi:hypothetical protein